MDLTSVRIWIAQRASAVLLVLLVAVHFGLNHFVDPTVKITFGLAQVRLQGMGYLVVDSLLLVVGLFHGLNGLRNIVLDYWPRVARPTTWVLIAMGIYLSAYGGVALSRFLI